MLIEIKTKQTNTCYFVFSSLLEESTDSSRVESAPTAESAPRRLSTQPLSLSTWLLKFWSLPATPARTSRSRESPLVTCSWLSAVTKSSTRLSRPPSLAVVWSLTSTRPWSLRATRSHEQVFLGKAEVRVPRYSLFKQTRSTIVSINDFWRKLNSILRSSPSATPHFQWLFKL